MVTAVEATTALGADIDSTWKALLAGESGIRVLEDEFVTKWDLPVRIGGHLVDPVDDHMGRLDMRRMSYVQRMSKYLGRRMWDSAGQPRSTRPLRRRDRHRSGRREDRRNHDLMNEGGPRKVSPLAVQMIMPNGAAAVVGLDPGLAPGLSPGFSVLVGIEAIAHAWRQIVMVTLTSPSAAASRA